MKQDTMLAMILAGGRGSRLHELTSKVAKPAVAYGGKYRIIDFPLSNCANSGIDVVGVLTQYESVLLNSYVSVGGRWGLDAKDSGVYVLPPREKADAELDVYRGTADAISQNIDFIDKFAPEYLLILSGDHIYKMNYAKMLAFHKEHKADATIAVIPVPLKEASRFGIMNTNEDGSIYEFEEKPAEPKSNLASMGIYIFNWKTLRKLLLADIKDPNSHHDFGKDIIPTLLNDGKSLYAYQFKGYWKDVGTIDSYYNTNMELLNPDSPFNIFEENMRVFSNSNIYPPHYIGPDAVVENSLVCNGCRVRGEIHHSILSFDVHIEDGARVTDSILLPGAKIGKNARIFRSIIGEQSVIGEDTVLGSPDSQEITVIGDNETIAASQIKGGVSHE